MTEEKIHKNRTGSWWALSPLLVFLCLYLVTSILVNDFYKVPITVAFLVSSCYAIAITPGLKLDQRIYQFSVGAANKNILLMIWIFILAGAFAHSAKQMGAIDATVNLTLHILPDNLLLAGIFIAACFISLSIGTSVGTIVALTPVAVGLAEKTEIALPFMVAVVVGGSFFGDNLSFISDTTIASTKTQECVMRDKFRVNSMIVVPAAIIVLGIYIFQGLSITAPTQTQTIEWLKVIPYIIVLGTAIAGMNVMLVLIIGILTSGIIGIATSSFGIFDWFGAMGTGITGMGELIIITLLAGGMLETIRYNGGIDFIIRKLTRHVNGKRGAELSIAALPGEHCQFMHCQQHDCHYHNRTDCQRYCHKIPSRPEKNSQYPGYILLSDTRNYPLWGTDADCSRTCQHLPYQYYRQSLLSVYDGSLCPARYPVPISEEVFIRKREIFVNQKKSRIFVPAITS